MPSRTASRALVPTVPALPVAGNGTGTNDGIPPLALLPVTQTAHGAVDMTPYLPLIAQLQAIETETNGIFIEREELTHQMLVTLVAGSNLVAYGPPGTAKSALIERLATCISTQLNGPGLQYFYMMLMRTTHPSELFGPVSVEGLKRDQFRYITVGSLLEAEIAFLDEVYKGGSAILNGLLTVMNERIFKMGGTLLQVPLLAVFAASNERPQEPDLAAFDDRFLLRVDVTYLSEAGFAELLRRPTLDTMPPPQATIGKIEIQLLQALARHIPVPPAVQTTLLRLWKKLGSEGIIISDRRWRQCLRLLQAEALLGGRGIVASDDLVILRDALCPSPDKRGKVGQIVGHLANPTAARAKDLFDQARSVRDATLAAKGTPQAVNAATEAVSKFQGEIEKELEKLWHAAAQKGGVLTQLSRYLDTVEDWRWECITQAMPSVTRPGGPVRSQVLLQALSQTAAERNPTP